MNIYQVFNIEKQINVNEYNQIINEVTSNYGHIQHIKLIHKIYTNSEWQQYTYLLLMSYQGTYLLDDNIDIKIINNMFQNTNHIDVEVVLYDLDALFYNFNIHNNYYLQYEYHYYNDTLKETQVFVLAQSIQDVDNNARFNLTHKNDAIKYLVNLHSINEETKNKIINILSGEFI